MKDSSSANSSFGLALILCSFRIAGVVNGFAPRTVSISPQIVVTVTQQPPWATRPQTARRLSLSSSARWLSTRAEEAEKQLSRRTKTTGSPLQQQTTDETKKGFFDPFNNNQVQQVQGAATTTIKTEEEEEYLKGFATIGFITLLNASLAPVWHFVFEGASTPPPLFLNAVVSVVALLGLLVGGRALDATIGTSGALAEQGEQAWSKKSFRGGMELGVWKGLGKSL
jgi:hypothetical protein